MKSSKKNQKLERAREFASEVEDLLEILGKGLLELDKSFKGGFVEPTLINGIFRSAHTLKGVCGVFDFNEMVSLSHALENALDSIRLGKALLNEELLDSVLRAHELMLTMASTGEAKGISKELQALEKVLKRSSQKSKARRKEDHVDLKLLGLLTEYEEHRLVESIKQDNNILIIEVNFHLKDFDKEYDNFVKLLQSEAEVIATLPSKKKAKGEMVRLEMLAGTRVGKETLTDYLSSAVGGSVTLVNANPIIKGAPGLSWEPEMPEKVEESSPETIGLATNSVRVNIGKLDGVMNLVGDLGLLKVSLELLAQEVRGEMPYSEYGRELSRLGKHLDRKFIELRDSLLDIRMVQIGQLFSRYEALLSRLGRKTGKQVRMETFGAETELDKLMVEQLSDPIMHIVRNVVDHAIELPEEREKLNKDQTGTITLGAYQKGNRVVLEVTDDGCGIDIDAIRERSVTKGVVNKETAAGLSDRELLDMIFLPGFTTKDHVSEVSGRGVGLDVVKENIARLSGVIDIETEAGKGTKFIFTIPITLAIVQAIIVEDSSDRYALPLNSVTEVLTLDPALVTEEDGGLSVRINDRSLPFIRLSSFMGKEPLENSGQLHCIVAGIAEHRLVIAVERIVEQLDLVIKPLSGPIKVTGIAGAADLSMDGEKGTVLVLDVSGIMEEVVRERKGRKADGVLTEELIYEGLH